MLNIYQSIGILSSGFAIICAINYVYLKYFKENFNNKELKNNIMGCVFIIFGVLKIVNLDKFVSIFRKYDIISKQSIYYAYAYPFIEIVIGLSYLNKYKPYTTNIITIALMIISIISVSLSINNGDKLRCGCLGSFLHIPLSYVTISENIVMLLMSMNLILK